MAEAVGRMVVVLVVACVVVGKRGTGVEARTWETRSGDAHPAVFAMRVFVEGCLAHCGCFPSVGCWWCQGCYVQFLLRFRLLKRVRHGALILRYEGERWLTVWEVVVTAC